MARRLRVLVLDDEPIVGKRLERALEKIGCDVEIFIDPEMALARIRQQEFDVVVTDVVMGEIDGIQVLERVLEQWPRTKVIMITGYAMTHMVERAVEKGAFDFVAKPFSPDDLRKAVRRAAAELGIDVGAELEQER